MEDCIFCKIIKGEIPSTKVYEDDNVLAFKDINPAAPIHILVVPKQHIENVLEINEENKEIASNIFLAINKIAKQLGIDKNGFRVITNCGKDAGQEVMHLHFHILAGGKMGPKIVWHKKEDKVLGKENKIWYNKRNMILYYRRKRWAKENMEKY